MNLRMLLVSVGLLIGSGTAYSQPPIPISDEDRSHREVDIACEQLRLHMELVRILQSYKIQSQVYPPPPSGVLPVPLPISAKSPEKSPAKKSPEKSIDELLDELERVKADRAALEKKEQELKAALQKKLELQSERLKKLGIAPQPTKEAEPDRVGKIVIEGNTKTPDSKILNMLQLYPGQILQYPKLEEARKKLEKAGFHDVKVELIPNELDSAFKDIYVKINESKR